jgi:hypothetical protein
VCICIYIYEYISTCSLQKLSDNFLKFLQYEYVLHVIVRALKTFVAVIRQFLTARVLKLLFGEIPRTRIFRTQKLKISTKSQMSNSSSEIPNFGNFAKKSFRTGAVRIGLITVRYYKGCLSQLWPKCNNTEYALILIVYSKIRISKRRFVILNDW